MDIDRGRAVRAEQAFESTLESVDEAEAMILDTAAKAGFSEDEQHHISMAARESLVNAVVHGNRYNVHKKVLVNIEASEERIRIEITDEGEGFDPSGIPDPVAEENLLKHSGRGIFLIRAFMDGFEMKKIEPRGTRVTLVKERGRDEEK